MNSRLPPKKKGVRMEGDCRAADFAVASDYVTSSQTVRKRARERAEWRRTRRQHIEECERRLIELMQGRGVNTIAVPDEDAVLTLVERRRRPRKTGIHEQVSAFVASLLHPPFSLPEGGLATVWEKAGEVARRDAEKEKVQQPRIVIRKKRRPVG